MALISFNDYLKTASESTASTRAKKAAALGLGPDVADVFGHSTPPPWQVDKLLKKNKKSKKDIQERKEMQPDYSFDRFVRKAASTSDQIDKEISKGDKESDQIDKKVSKEKLSKKDQEKKIDKPSQKLIKPTPKTATDQNDPKPDRRQDRKEKEVVANTEKITEEQVWLKLLDTSFDQSKYY